MPPDVVIRNPIKRADCHGHKCPRNDEDIYWLVRPEKKLTLSCI